MLLTFARTEEITFSSSGLVDVYGKEKKISVRLKKIGSNVKEAYIVACLEEKKCKDITVSNKTKKSKYVDLKVKHDEFVYLDTSNSSGAHSNYYIAVTTYNKSGSKLATVTYKLTKKEKKSNNKKRID